MKYFTLVASVIVVSLFSVTSECLGIPASVDTIKNTNAEALASELYENISGASDETTIQVCRLDDPGCVIEGLDEYRAGSNLSVSDFPAWNYSFRLSRFGMFVIGYGYYNGHANIEKIIDGCIAKEGGTTYAQCVSNAIQLSCALILGYIGTSRSNPFEGAVTLFGQARTFHGYALEAAETQHVERMKCPGKAHDESRLIGQHFKPWLGFHVIGESGCADLDSSDKDLGVLADVADTIVTHRFQRTDFTLFYKNKAAIGKFSHAFISALFGPCIHPIDGPQCYEK